MGKPDPPTPPNPQATAAAQTGTNVSTAVANAYLNNVNQNTPDGSLSYAATGSYGWTDPSTGQTYNIPTFTSTQTLSPQGQAIKDQTLGTQLNLATMGNQQSARVSGLLSQPFDPSSAAPTAGNAQNILNVPAASTSYDAGGPIQSSIGGYGQQQTSFDTSGAANPNNVQSTYGSGLDVNAVQQAMWGQMQPGLDVQQNKLQQQLADQGIRPGSAAYNNAMQPFGAQYNNALLQTITGATGQQATEMGIQNQLGQFNNAAQQQAYNEQQGIGQFANTAQQNMYQQALGAGAFANQAQGQQNAQNSAAATFNNAGLAQQLGQQQSGFNAQNAALNQYLQQAYQQRNQPLNEISALMSGSQLQNPNWLNSPTSQIATTDVAGITNQNFQNQMGIYNAQSQQYNALMGGILGLGAGALKASDRRLKDDITPMGTVLAAGDDGERKELPIYQYSYKQDPASLRHIGPMAQDVEQIQPGAVEEHGGRKFIRPREVMGSILRAA